MYALGSVTINLCPDTCKTDGLFYGSTVGEARAYICIYRFISLLILYDRSLQNKSALTCAYCVCFQSKGRAQMVRVNR